jgi:hypothetical protein
VIRQNIDYVVGMKTSIGDEAAIKFAVAFYDAIFAGTDFRVAFDFGCTAINLHNLPDTEAPVFLTSPQLGGTNLQYTENIPEIENTLHAYLNTPYAERHGFTTKGEKLADAMRTFYGERDQHAVTKVTVVAKRHIEGSYWRLHFPRKAMGLANWGIWDERRFFGAAHSPDGGVAAALPQQTARQEGVTQKAWRKASCQRSLGRVFPGPLVSSLQGTVIRPSRPPVTKSRRLAPVHL